MSDDTARKQLEQLRKFAEALGDNPYLWSHIDLVKLNEHFAGYGLPPISDPKPVSMIATTEGPKPMRGTEGV